jgi:hypothetical protein
VLFFIVAFNKHTVSNSRNISSLRKCRVFERASCFRVTFSGRDPFPWRESHLNMHCNTPWEIREMDSIRLSENETIPVPTICHRVDFRP